jgi:hypothetical protein
MAKIPLLIIKPAMPVPLSPDSLPLAGERDTDSLHEIYI